MAICTPASPQSFLAPPSFHECTGAHTHYYSYYYGGRSSHGIHIGRFGDRARTPSCGYLAGPDSRGLEGLLGQQERALLQEPPHTTEVDAMEKLCSSCTGVGWVVVGVGQGVRGCHRLRGREDVAGHAGGPAGGRGNVGRLAISQSSPCKGMDCFERRLHSECSCASACLQGLGSVVPEGPGVVAGKVGGVEKRGRQ